MGALHACVCVCMRVRVRVPRVRCVQLPCHHHRCRYRRAPQVAAWGAVPVCLHVYEDNAPARQLYTAKLGMQVAARDPSWWVAR